MHGQRVNGSGEITRNGSRAVAGADQGAVPLDAATHEGTGRKDKTKAAVKTWLQGLIWRMSRKIGGLRDRCRVEGRRRSVAPDYRH